MIYRFVFCALLLTLSACSYYDRELGAANIWRELPPFEPGKTHKQEVLTALGPPSQIIEAANHTVFYYLNERIKGEGLILILYNRSNETTVYDRAVFFFDANDRLTDYAYSHENNVD